MVRCVLDKHLGHSRSVVEMKVKSLSWVQLFATPRTVGYQVPPSMGFPRQEYWIGLPFPSPRDLPDPGIKPGSPSLQADALTSEPPGKPRSVVKYLQHFYLSVFKAKFRFSPYSKADSSLESHIFIPPAQCFSEVWISCCSHHQLISEDFSSPPCNCCDVSLADIFSFL